MPTRTGSKGKTRPLLVGVQTHITTMKTNMEAPQKTGNQSTSRSTYTTLGKIPKDALSYHRDTCTIMFMKAFIHSSQKLVVPQLKRGFFKMWYIYPVVHRQCTPKTQDLHKKEDISYRITSATG